MTTGHCLQMINDRGILHCVYVIVRFLAKIIILGLLTALFAGCGGAPVVKFVVPAGYSGRIIIVEDSDNGLDSQTMGRDYEYKIPKDGKLVLKPKAVEPLYKWHKELFVFSDGTLIPNEDSTATVKFFQRGVITTLADSRPTHVRFVGTKAQADCYFKNNSGTECKK